MYADIVRRGPRANQQPFSDFSSLIFQNRTTDGNIYMR